jgi:hypothetical protein
VTASHAQGETLRRSVRNRAVRATKAKFTRRRSMKLKPLPTLLLCAALPAALPDALAAADRCEAHSAAKAPTIVELYTSEGCNSCPPADRWMSSLKGRSDVVALAFHVDYWDRLGWTDRFASAANTQRQQQVQRGTGLSFVYTPQVLVDGHDWRQWPALPAASRAGVVELQLVRDGDRVQASVKPLPGAPGSLAAYWATTEDGHVSNVKAGENAGVTLRHDNVVRSYQPVPAWAASGVHELSTTSPPLGEGQRPRRTVLVVTDGRSGAPLNAAALSCGS